MNNGKVRIYELSKELNLDNKDIKEICEQLNIAVKSHSSTITAEDAARVKSVAAKSPRAEKTNDVQKKETKTLKAPKAPKAPAKRKQQILAVHHRGDGPSLSSRPQMSDSNGGSSARLAAPPSRPKAPNGNGSAGTGMSATSAQSNAANTATPSQTKRITAVQPPKLTAPPSRSQAKTSSRSSVQPPIKPKIRSTEAPQSKSESTETEPREKKKISRSATKAQSEATESPGCR